MVQSWFFRLAAGICVFCLSAAPVFGQAVFAVSSSQRTAADVGVTELTGQIAIVVQSGTTVSAPLQIQYSAQITNSLATDITVSGTGNLGGVPHATFAGDGTSIIINVPAGGTTPNRITIQGVRVAIAGQHYTSVTATVSSPTGAGNSISGSNTVTVIGTIIPALAVDMSTTQPLTFRAGAALNTTSTFTIKEGFASAFTYSAAFPGLYGQTVDTEIRVTPYPSLPTGVTITFQGTLNDESGNGGVLQTASGLDETIPHADGTTSVVYSYAGAPSSAPQSFPITVTLSSVSSTAGSGLIDFQLALIPIGIASPTPSSPSADIPRYWEQLVPDPSALPGFNTTVELAFPFRAQSDATYTGFAMTNPMNFQVSVTLTPYDGSGSSIASPVTFTIPPNGQIAKLATDSDVFGPGFNATSGGTIRAVGRTPTLAGFYLLGDINGPRLDGANGAENLLGNWTWPVIFRQTPSPFTTFEMFNPSTGTATVGLTLSDSNGATLATPSQSINASGTATLRFQDLFPGVDLNSFTGGYVVGHSDVPLVVRETFGNSLDSNVLTGQASQANSTFYLPHFATGGGYTTELTIVDTDVMEADLTVTLLDGNGASITGPAAISIKAGKQSVQTLASLFPALGASLITGYIRIDEAPIYRGPFPAVYPSIAGSLRFSIANGSSSSALPLNSSSASDFVYSHVAEAAGFWTGIAILNTNSTAASVTVQVLTASGASLGTKTLTLQPGQKTSQLLDQLVPAAAGQSSGYIHITSSLPVVSFSLFGTNNGLSLSAIPLQNIGN
jgi:hypothetical protein